MLVVMLVRAIDACVRAGVLTYFLARRAPWMRKNGLRAVRLRAPALDSGSVGRSVRVCLYLNSRYTSK